VGFYEQPRRTIAKPIIEMALRRMMLMLVPPV